MDEGGTGSSLEQFMSLYCFVMIPKNVYRKRKFNGSDERRIVAELIRKAQVTIEGMCFRGYRCMDICFGRGQLCMDSGVWHMFNIYTATQ